MSQAQEQQQQVNFSINELIFAQLKDLGSRMDRLEHRQDRLEEKLEITRQELNETRKELSSKIDKLSDKVDSSSNHGQIANISTIGIALAVIYSILK